MTRQQNQIWGVRKEGYGMIQLEHAVPMQSAKPKKMSAVRFVGEPKKDDSLMHYGVKGMHWGEITKEYEPVAFDKRTLKKAQAASPAAKLRRAVGSRIAKARQKEEAEWQQTRKEMIAAREKRNRLARNLAIGAITVGALLAAYGAYRCTFLAKKKAYAGIMNRFLTSNPGADPFGRASQLAKANGGTLGQAGIVNRYLGRKGLGLKGKRLRSVASAKSLINRLEKIPQGKTKVGKALFGRMRSRTQARIFDKLYF